MQQLSGDAALYGSRWPSDAGTACANMRAAPGKSAAAAKSESVLRLDRFIGLRKPE